MNHLIGLFLCCRLRSFRCYGGRTAACDRLLVVRFCTSDNITAYYSCDKCSKNSNCAEGTSFSEFHRGLLFGERHKIHKNHATYHFYYITLFLIWQLQIVSNLNEFTTRFKHKMLNFAHKTTYLRQILLFNFSIALYLFIHTKFLRVFCTL